MRIQAEFSLIPLTGDPHLAKDIALCEKVLREHNLEVELHAMGTNIEGEWDTLMHALKACHEAVHQTGRNRLYTVIKIVSNVAGEKPFAAKVESVQHQLDALQGK
ncbi:MAG: MTH1187 family thiamine-binding protein [Methylohalobius sp. ZOD2]